MPAAQSFPLDVLFEDEHLIAVAKQAGVVVHPCYKHPDGTLHDALVFHLRGTGVHPHLLQRLDKHTSGAMLASKTMRAHAIMVRAMQRAPGPAGGVRKEYLAVVHGAPDPPAGDISLRLRRHATDSRRVAASMTEGKESRTGYRTLASADGSGMSLLVCQLFTGRMHQVRVHLAASGWPLVGDPVYGTGDHVDGPIGRQALHSWRISFQHPIDRTPIAITAPVPPDMAALLDRIGVPVPG